MLVGLSKLKSVQSKTLGPTYHDTVFNQPLAPVNLHTNSSMKTNPNRAGTITRQVVYLNRQLTVRLVTGLEINNIRKQNQAYLSLERSFPTELREGSPAQTFFQIMLSKRREVERNPQKTIHFEYNMAQIVTIPYSHSRRLPRLHLNRRCRPATPGRVRSLRCRSDKQSEFIIKQNHVRKIC